MKYKAFKFRLVPNKEQQTQISKTLGCCRFLYNQMLEEKQTKYKSKDKSKLKTEKQYKEEFSFLKEVDSISLQQSRIDLKNAYTNHFRKLKKKQKTSLKFKSKHNPKKSYRTVNVNNSIRVEGNKIKLPKLGLVRFKKSREILGNVKSVTVFKNILNRYYISILCETEVEILPKLNTKIGIGSFPGAIKGSKGGRYKDGTVGRFVQSIKGQPGKKFIQKGVTLGVHAYLASEL